MKKWMKIALLILVCVGVIALCVFMIPFVFSLREPENQQRLESFIKELGALGVLMMLFLQVLQIIVAVIPGEPLELLMGLMYGTWAGLALTLAGILIGTTIVFFLVKKYGEPFASRFVDIKSFEKLKFLRDPVRRDSLIFILFLIPGTPKDVLTYFAPLTGIKFSRFLPLAVLARIPSVISSTLVGATVGDGKLWQSALIFAATGLVGLAGILINSRIQKKYGGQNNSKGNPNE
ncbi:MAG: TVP38/TMEM64 family protein [Candidatus Flemingiibacterium sp.]